MIFILTKSAVPEKGRFGPTYLQDWFKCCVKAHSLMAPNDKIFITSAFRPGGEWEAEVYKKTLLGLGVPETQLEIRHQGLETTEQLEAIYAMAKKEEAEIVLISTFLHFPRVWWLTRGKEIKHSVLFGIPRPIEACTDIILAILYPLIDLLGFQKKFLAYTKTRRKKGKL